MQYFQDKVYICKKTNQQFFCAFDSTINLDFFLPCKTGTKTCRLFLSLPRLFIPYNEPYILFVWRMISWAIFVPFNIWKKYWGRAGIHQGEFIRRSFPRGIHQGDFHKKTLLLDLPIRSIYYSGNISFFHCIIRESDINLVH